MTEGFALYELIEDDEGRAVDWRILEVNDAYTRHTGIARDSDRRPAHQRGLSPYLSRTTCRSLPASWPPRRPVDFETYAKAIDRYMHIVTYPVGGRRFASIIEDISARRKAEAGPEGQRRALPGAVQQHDEGFALHEIVTDDAGHPLDFRFLDVNPAFERLTGLDRAGVVGQRVREVLKDIEPFWIETYGRVALTGEPYTFERYYPEPLNRWFEVYAYRPAPRQFAVVFMDISDRKRIEEALRESERSAREIAGDRPPRQLGARRRRRPADLVGRGLPDLRARSEGIRRDL